MLFSLILSVTLVKMHFAVTLVKALYFFEANHLDLGLQVQVIFSWTMSEIPVESYIKPHFFFKHIIFIYVFFFFFFCLFCIFVFFFLLLFFFYFFA